MDLNKVYGIKTQDMSNFGPNSPYKVRVIIAVDYGNIGVYLVEHIEMKYTFKPAGTKTVKYFSIEVHQMSTIDDGINMLHFEKLETKSIKAAKKAFEAFQW